METSRFKYLELWITQTLDTFYEASLEPQLKRLEQEVKHWLSLPISLLEREVMLKMVALQRFLYILQNSPYKNRKPG